VGAPGELFAGGKNAEHISVLQKRGRGARYASASYDVKKRDGKIGLAAQLGGGEKKAARGSLIDVGLGRTWLFFIGFATNLGTKFTNLVPEET